MKIAVFLIHGTFAPDASWIENNSFLVNSIRNSLGKNIVFMKFKWDGLNSFSSRAHAASLLSQELDNVANSGEYSRICLVAHSHGGNIAINAVANMRHSSRITAMVSLGTPYLRITRKVWAPPEMYALTLSFWLGTIFAFFLQNIFVLPIMLLLFPFLSVRLKRAKDESQNLSVLKPSLGGAGILPVLCVRHGGDEASAWLSLLSIPRIAEAILAAIGGRFAGKFWRSLLMFSLLSFGLSALFAFTMSFHIGGYFLIASIIVYFFLPVLSALGTLLTSHRFGLGGRPNFKSLFLYPHVTSKPFIGDVHEAKFSGLCGTVRASSFWPLKIVTPHSLGYSDPKAIRKLTGWLKTMCY